MFLPPLAPYPFVAINLLFCGPQTGPEMRRTLAALGHQRSAASFSRTMTELSHRGYVAAAYASRPGDGQPIRELRYEVTDLGVLAWTGTQDFFASFSPPSADLVPAASESLDTAAYDAATLVRRDRDEMHALLAKYFRPRRRRCHEC